MPFTKLLLLLLLLLSLLLLLFKIRLVQWLIHNGLLEHSILFFSVRNFGEKFCEKLSVWFYLLILLFSSSDSIFRAAFQYGVKMADGRKTRRAGPKDEKKELDKEWQKIQNIIAKNKPRHLPEDEPLAKMAKYWSVFCCFKSDWMHSLCLDSDVLFMTFIMICKVTELWIQMTKTELAVFNRKQKMRWSWI